MFASVLQKNLLNLVLHFEESTLFYTVCMEVEQDNTMRLNSHAHEEGQLT